MFKTFGMRLRAVTQNPEIAKCFGINADRVYSLTFAYGAGLAGLAGELVSPLKSVAPDMGTGSSSMHSWWWWWRRAEPVGHGGQRGSARPGLWRSRLLHNDTMAKALVFFGVVLLIRFRPQGLFAVKMRPG